MSEQANATTVRQWVETGLNNGDLSMVDRAYTPEYVLHGPGTEIPSAEAFKQFCSGWFTGFPDFRMTINDMIAAGDKVVWRFTITGTHHGEFLGVAPTGRPITFTAIVITRFANGVWTEDWLECDFLGLFQQLGAIPAPAGAAT